MLFGDAGDDVLRAVDVAGPAHETVRQVFRRAGSEVVCYNGVINIEAEQDARRKELGVADKGNERPSYREMLGNPPVKNPAAVY